MISLLAITTNTLEFRIYYIYSFYHIVMTPRYVQLLRTILPLPTYLFAAFLERYKQKSRNGDRNGD